MTGTPTALAAGGDSEVYVVGLRARQPRAASSAQLAPTSRRSSTTTTTPSPPTPASQMLVDGHGQGQVHRPGEGGRGAGRHEASRASTGDVEMRKSDHQLQQPLYIAKWQKADKKYPYSVENTGYTFVPIKQMDPYVASTPTTCQMKRPASAS